METKELNIVAPQGYEIDKENSTFECIKFKKIEQKKWRYDINAKIKGYFISGLSDILKIHDDSHHNINVKTNHNIFVTEKQAKSALAMAQISQIMANDERFGGVVSDDEWKQSSPKYCISNQGGEISKPILCASVQFLAFHTPYQRDLFLQENEDLVKDYLMID